MKKIIFFLIFTFLITTGLGCKGLSADEQEAIKPIILNYWRVFDDSDSFADIIAAYNALHPNVTINYKKLRPEEFETELINALAEDRGPDMFSIQNTWITAYQSKILPMPASVRVVSQRIEGSYQKKLVVNIANVPTPTAKQIQDTFVSAVAADVIRPEINAQGQQVKNIWGIPLALDTLVLYYNKTMLDAGGIAEPPKNWEDFQKDVKLLSKISPENKILQSGAALGTSKNVLRSADILALLMMQNGTVMVGENGYPSFNLMPQEVKLPTTPAAQALQFYTDFANSTKEVYSWNTDMPESLDAFVRGQTAFFFGYAYHLPFIRARAPKMNFNIVSVPQVNQTTPVNFAAYWVETVSKKTAHSNEAWDFILFSAKAENVVKYLEKVEKPTALRALIAGQKEDPDLQAFANELLTAKSWYRGKDAVKADGYFTGMIDEVFKPEALNDAQVYQKAVNNAAVKVGQTM